ncbi:MAG TPA: hypothetical protein VEZ70_01035 [Allosphingosinicella sp.]|nr:hypothetical protein [Allosphingosinicella sp.]
MPRYFFHFENCGVQLRDKVGLSLPDAEAAWYQAVRSVRDLIRAEGTIGCGYDGQAVAIEDDSGFPVDRLPFGEIAGFAGTI